MPSCRSTCRPPTPTASRTASTRSTSRWTCKGRYSINRSPIAFSSAAAFSAELRRAAGNAKDPVIVITADANAPHQSVINIMEAARLAGYGKITFTTQAGKK